jgi:cytoskeletal protein CcmA (bactofilin family)
MNPVPRERLPYPDLPVQPQERERERERPMSRSAQAAAPSPRTVISKESTFNGNVRSDGDILIEGSFEGEIDCKGTVIIAEGANVSATVRARNSTVAGSANGDFTCEERLTIQSSGEMRGKAQAPTLVVEEGAFFEGEFKMGSGGLTSVSSNLSSWQTGRSGTTRSTSPQPQAAGDDE